MPGRITSRLWGTTKDGWSRLVSVWVRSTKANRPPDYIYQECRYVDLEVGPQPPCRPRAKEAAVSNGSRQFDLPVH